MRIRRADLLVPRRFAGQNRPMEDVYLVIRFTRHWIHYGLLAHMALCVMVAAVEGVLGR